MKALWFSVWLLAERFLRCTRCCNYGTPCHCYGGSIARRIFRHREEVKETTDDALGFVLGGLLLLFPVLVLVFMGEKAMLLWRLLGLAGHVIVMGSWLALVRSTGCGSCKNTACTLYKE